MIVMIISGTVTHAALGFEVKAMVIDLYVAYWKYLYIRQFTPLRLIYDLVLRFHLDPCNNCMLQTHANNIPPFRSDNDDVPRS
jgi:hypothetical protein